MVRKNRLAEQKEKQPLLANQIITLAKIEYRVLLGDTSQTLSEREHRYLYKILMQQGICTFTNGTELFGDMRELANS